ncbi:MAG: S8 family serine peptidase [Kineosporiaceae bacterium]
MWRPLTAVGLALALVAGPAAGLAEAKSKSPSTKSTSPTPTSTPTSSSTRTSTSTSTSSLESALAALAAAYEAELTNPTGELSANPDGSFDPATDPGSLYNVARIIGADKAWAAGYTGAGVDVAVIDTGVSPVPGLTSGNVVNGPDLSFDSQSPALTDLDAFGHGTHMASLIAGRDEQSAPKDYPDDGKFAGIAPDARLVSLKVGASDGAVDVSQVIAAVTWVTEHAHTDGLNIRVLSLSYGTDATSWSLSDPMTYAVEQAWNAGIVVVVAGGNDGTDRLTLANPAMDPRIIAVGASDAQGTLDTANDTVPYFSARGNLLRHVDLVAPGTHIAGLAVPGSVLTETYPSGLVASRYLRGSGTSQAAAVTAGAAALLLQRYPTLTPDQVKAMLVATAHGATGTPVTFRGAGVLDIRAAQLMTPPTVTALPGYATGTGSLEAARGTSRVAQDDVELTGEQDIFGRAWNPTQYATLAAARSTWSGGMWNGTTWTGTGWNGTSWTGRSWTGRSWTGRSWTDSTWTGRSWTGRAWVGDAWIGRSWTGRSWTDATWSGALWL